MSFQSSRNFIVQTVGAAIGVIIVLAMVVALSAQCGPPAEYKPQVIIEATPIRLDEPIIFVDLAHGNVCYLWADSLDCLPLTK